MELPENLEVIIFDFDGTLHDLAVDWEKVKVELGLEGRRTITSVLEGKNNDHIRKITLAEIDAIKGQALREDVKHTLQSLEKRYKLAIYTRNSRETVAKLFGSDFPEILIVGREDTENLKPHPQGIDIILEKLNTSLKNAILVGDTYHDVEAAKAAGIQSIVVTNPKLQYRPEGADAYIDNIESLTNLVG